jgi:hypothetical protein
MSGEAPLIQIKPFLPTAAAHGHYSPSRLSDLGFLDPKMTFLPAT